MLKDMDDLSLDNPDVVPMVCNFIARAMVDDVLPPGFFDFLPLRLVKFLKSRDFICIITCDFIYRITVISFMKSL